MRETMCTFWNGVMQQKRRLFFLLGIFAIVVASLLLFSLPQSAHSSPTVVSKATLENIIKVTDLSTFESVYNGIASVANHDSPDSIDYYVTYDGRVKAGIDVSDITVDVDTHKKSITVSLPEVKITDISVDITTLDYLFINDKANTYFVSEEAYRKCIEDITEKSRQETILFELAEENAKNFIHALLSPFVAAFDSQYEIQIL